MNWKYLHQTPVAKITFVIFFSVSIPALFMDPTDLMLCAFFYPIIILLLTPLLCGIRAICKILKIPKWPRRTVMLIPVIAVAFLVMPSPNKQAQGFLRHGMGGVPKKMKIVNYEGNSGFFVDYCQLSMTCDPNSLRKILHSQKLSPVSAEIAQQRRNNEPVGLETVASKPEDRIYFANRFCTVTTDASYRWARFNYVAGDM